LEVYFEAVFIMIYIILCWPDCSERAEYE